MSADKIDTSREAVERLLDGVTPGPWAAFIDDTGGEWSGWPLCIDATTIDDKTVVRTGGQWPYEWGAKTSQHEACQNARFIAAARDLVPALLARAEAAEAERDRAMQACEQIASRLDAALVEVDRLSAPPDDAEVAALVELLVDRDNPVGMEAADALTRLSHALAAETSKREEMEEALEEISTYDTGGTAGVAYTAKVTLAKHGSKT